jgi:hypothetical protein
MTAIDGNTMEGVSATTLWTPHNRGTEAKRSDGVIRHPWAVTLLDTIDYDYLKFGKPNQSHGLRAVAFDNEARDYLGGHPGASALALAGTVPRVRAARDVPLPPGRGWWKLAPWPALDRIGLHRRIRPSNTVLEFG